MVGSRLPGGVQQFASCRGHRQTDGEAASTRFVRHVDVPAMRLYETLGNGQSQSSLLARRGASGRVPAVAQLEHTSQICLGDTSMAY